MGKNDQELYFETNQSFECFLLVDSRLEPQQLDLDFIKWLGVSQIPFSIVFTKEDKLKRMQLDKNLKVYQKTLYAEWQELPRFFIASAVTVKGKEDILAYISETNQLLSS